MVHAQEDVWDLIEKGQRHVSYGRLDTALTTFEKVLQIDPRNVTALNAAAQVAAFLERWDQAAFYNSAYLYLEGDFLGDGAADIRDVIAKHASKIEGAGKLKISVMPEQAEILVNGIPIGQGKAIIDANPEKSYRVTLAVDDYHPLEKVLTVGAGETKNISLRMKKIVYHGKVRLKLVPGGDVKVYLDTELVGTSVAEIEAVEGKRLLCFKKEGFDRWWRYVHVPRNDSTELEVTLRSQSRPDGACTIWPEEEGY
jgi:hypothetical protein